MPPGTLSVPPVPLPSGPAPLPHEAAPPRSGPVVQQPEGPKEKVPFPAPPALAALPPQAAADPAVGKMEPVPEARASTVPVAAVPASRLGPERAVPPPGPPDEPAVAALRAYLRQQPAEALDALQRYPKASQDMMLGVLPVLARLTEGNLEQMSPREAADLVDRLRRLEDGLRGRAALQIDKMLYCRKVGGFGRVEPWPEDHAFEAGPEGKPGELVQVYAELSNFSTRANGACHETWLAGRVEVRDEARKVVWFENFPPRADRSHSPKRDYSVTYYFWVPPGLPPGRYTLWVQVKDVTGAAPASGEGLAPSVLDVPDHRTAVGSLEFRVKGPGAGKERRATAAGNAAGARSGTGGEHS